MSDLLLGLLRAAGGEVGSSSIQKWRQEVSRNILNFTTGSYRGNGLPSQDILIGFTPRVLVIVHEATDDLPTCVFIKIDSMTSTNVIESQEGLSSQITTTGVELIPGGFRVSGQHVIGVPPDANDDSAGGQDYSYVALG